MTKVSSCSHTTCACVNNTQKCSYRSWLGVSMCNRHSSVIFALYCVNTKIKMQAAHMMYAKDERFFYSFCISATMRITPWFHQNLQNISQTNPSHGTGILQYFFVNLKKRVQLRMCRNLGGLVRCHCGRIMENGTASFVEDANTSKCQISVVLRSLCQMLKRMKYHIYQPLLVPNYTFLLSIHPFSPSFFARTNQGTDFCRTIYVPGCPN